MNSEELVSALVGEYLADSPDPLIGLSVLERMRFRSLDDLLIQTIVQFREDFGLPPIPAHEALEQGRTILSQNDPLGYEMCLLDFHSHSNCAEKIAARVYFDLADAFREERLRVALALRVASLPWSQQLALVEDIKSRHGDLFSPEVMGTPAHALVDELPRLLLDIAMTEAACGRPPAPQMRGKTLTVSFNPPPF